MTQTLDMLSPSSSGSCTNRMRAVTLATLAHRVKQHLLVVSLSAGALNCGVVPVEDGDLREADTD
jgi:hypothetical protein